MVWEGNPPGEERKEEEVEGKEFGEEGQGEGEEQEKEVRRGVGDSEPVANIEN